MSTVKWREGLKYDIDLTMETVKFRFNWSDWLSELGADTLSDAIIVIDSGLVATGKLVAATYAEFTFSCAVGVNAPTVGSILKVTCKAETGGGQSKPKTILFEVTNDSGS